ncbi:NlpC/P60 family protein [Arthrobacter sp.]|uniref:C40 family peptidase n=1 Tax=Arthrobacter sp. TaxID=1667 RepID=UPI003A94FC11
MAKGQLLGVATCTLALIGGTLVSGTAAIGAPTTIDSTIGTSTFGTVFPAAAPAQRTLPTRADVTAAKKDPAALKSMVASLEGLILDSNDDLATAEASAMNDQDAYETTSGVLAERNAAAQTARAEAAKATAYYDAVKKQVGQLAGDLYRNGGINPGVSSMLNASEHNDVLYKAATMQTLAANRSATLTTAQQAASLWAEWQNYAADAEAAAADAADANESALAAAERTRSAYATRVDEQKKLRDELIGQLAYLQDTKRAEEAKRVAALENQQREDRLKAELAATPAEPAAQKPAETVAVAAAPQAVPDAVPTSTSLSPASKPKTTNSRPATVATNSPARTSKPAADPRPVAASTPKPITSDTSAASKAAEQAAAQRKAEAKAAAQRQAAEEAKANDEARRKAAKEEADAKAAAKAEADAKAAAEAAQERAEEAARKKAAEEAARASSGSSKESAIAWALKTAADDSNYYVYGGNGPDAYDCSSFVRAAFAQSGISLPRTSTSQYFAGGTKVRVSQLKRGDLVFSTSNGGSSFYHVAIYLGNGQVVHARNPSVGISTTPLSWVNNMYSYGVRY